MRRPSNLASDGDLPLLLLGVEGDTPPLEEDHDKRRRARWETRVMDLLLRLSFLLSS